MKIEMMSDKELKELAVKLRIQFDWSEWLSPRYQLIMVIKDRQKEADKRPECPHCCGQYYGE